MSSGLSFRPLSLTPFSGRCGPLSTFSLPTPLSVKKSKERTIEYVCHQHLLNHLIRLVKLFSEVLQCIKKTKDYMLRQSYDCHTYGFMKLINFAHIKILICNTSKIERSKATDTSLLFFYDCLLFYLHVFFYSFILARIANKIEIFCFWKFLCQSPAIWVTKTRVEVAWSVLTSRTSLY